MMTYLSSPTDRIARLHIASALVALVIACSPVATDAAVVIDSLDNTVTATSGIAANSSSGKAVNFVMPGSLNRPYVLESFVLDLVNYGAQDTAVVQLWSDDGTAQPIGSLLETLANPAVPVTNGLNTFTSIGTLLQPGETYWVVVRTTTGDFGWPASSDQTVESDIGATHTGRLFPSGGNAGTPGTWTSASGVLNRVQVNASYAVPAPAALPAGLTLMTLATLRRRRRATMN